MEKQKKNKIDFFDDDFREQIRLLTGSTFQVSRNELIKNIVTRGFSETVRYTTGSPFTKILLPVKYIWNIPFNLLRKKNLNHFKSAVKSRIITLENELRESGNVEYILGDPDIINDIKETLNRDINKMYDKFIEIENEQQKRMLHF